MHKAWNWHVRVFAARVRHLDRRSIRFFQPRDNLSTNRAVRVFRVNQVKKMGGDRKRELVAGQYDSSAFFARESDPPLELPQVRYSIFELPFPVAPEFGSNIGPEARREGKEPLISGFS